MNVFLVVVSLALFVNVSFADQACGSRGRNCVPDAKCVNGNCECASGSKGDGAFACYSPSTVAAEIINDPKLTNFNNESIDFPYPCRYLATHIVQDMKSDSGDVIGTCEFLIYAFNAKSRGKFFSHGFDVASHLKYAHGQSVKFSSRHYGEAKFGKYTFKSKGTRGEFYQNGPWENDDVTYVDGINGVSVQINRNSNANQLVYEVQNCGLKITFVPYDIKDRQAQVSIPGLSIGVDRNYNTRWLSNDEVMALAPVEDGGATLADKRIKKLNVEQSMFVRAFKAGFVQNMPIADKGKCDATHKAFRKCRRSEVRKAIRNCYWMLNQPRFIYCMDKSKSGRKILRLFAHCVKVWCASTKCSKVQDAIIKAGCDTVRDIKPLPRFMAGKMCPEK